MTHDNTPAPAATPTASGGFDDPEVLRLAQEMLAAEDAPSEAQESTPSTDLDLGPVLIDYGHSPSEVFDHTGTPSLHHLDAHLRACPHPVLVEATDADIAQGIAAALRPVMRLDARDGRAARFYEWDGDVWKVSNGDPGIEAFRTLVEPWTGPDATAAQRQRRIIAVKYVAADTDDEYQRNAVKLMGGKLLDEGTDKARFVDADGLKITSLPVEDKKWAKRAATAQNVGVLLRSDKRMRVPTPLPTTAGVSDWDTASGVLATPGQYIDLHGKTSTPPNPELLITRTTRARFDGAAECPVWMQFLSDIFPDEHVRDYVHRAVGMTISGEHTEDVLLYLVGESGSNGKSIFTDTLVAVLGEYATSIDPGLVAVNRANSSSGPRPELLTLRGRRMVLIPELKPGQSLDTELVKHWTGGGEIAARAMYGNDVTRFQATFVPWFTSNGTPSVPPGNAAFWRRYRGVPFVARFATTVEELPGATGMADFGLRGKLRAEHSGILNWILDGYMRWHATPLGGGITPPAILAQSKLARVNSSPWASFVDDCLTTDGCTGGDRLEIGAIWKAWTSYKKAYGGDATHRPLSPKHVPSALMQELRSVQCTPRAGGKNPAMAHGVKFTDEGAERFKLAQMIWGAE